MTLFKCFYCQSEVDPRDPFTRQRVMAWEHRGVGGTRRGGSDIELRERMQEFACGHCLDALKHGRAPKQESLI